MQKNKILSTNDKIYYNFKKSIIQTWITNAEKHDIQCIFYEGSAVDRLEKNILKIDCCDKTQSTGKKLYKALDFIVKNNIDFTHIYRTNLSSFIYIEDFIKYYTALPKIFYGGYRNHFFKFIFLNRLHESIQLVLKKYLL
jgi:hypothetical protein